MFRKSIYSLFVFLTALTLTSCVDEITSPDDPGEGTTDVSFDITFEPLMGTETSTGRGTDGDAIANINDLALVIYNQDGSLNSIVDRSVMQNYNVSQKGTVGANTGMPSGVDADKQAEASTARASFTLKGFQVGRYYIYAVANMSITNTEANREKFADIQSLRKIRLEWNSANIAANNQMFGYVTTENASNSAEGFDAPLVTVSRTANRLHAWLKRAASKVTVVFDGSGLKDNIRIYVKSVTIKDIPRYCLLGENNTVTSTDQLIADGECIYYNSEGVIEDGTSPDADWNNWLSISRGSGKKGAVTDRFGNEELHSEYAKALFFFENMQGDYEGNERYNKQPQWDNVGFVPESPDDYDFKDNIHYGTYIEVDAYYVSQNQDYVSQGKIKYRFMLGKNITYNYDAQRNHHYKVTLGFKGYANQPDWHIVYQEVTPEIYTVNNYFVSYQYNRMSTFPIRITGDVTGVEFEIVRNDWAPSDPSQPDGMAQAYLPSSWDLEEPFQWNKEVYENASGTYYYGLQKPWSSDGKTQITYSAEEIAKGAPQKVTPVWAGFLSLSAPGKTRQDIPTNIYHVDDGYSYSKDYAYLKDYFYGRGVDKSGKTLNGVPQNLRTFSAADLTFPGWQEGVTSEIQSKTLASGTNNECTIQKLPDGSTVINLPLWTRPKILMGISGFSGNNPYDSYRRKATIKVTAKFGNGQTVTKYVPVQQVRRIVNPKGVWRKYNETAPFHVRLVCRESVADHNFTELKSEGAWRAYVQTFSPGAEGFITLQGGIGRDADGAIIGATDTPIDFNIIFNGQADQFQSRCAIVIVQYHDYNCYHPILVRQGFNTALQVVEGGAYWSSYSLYKCDAPPTIGTTWNATTKNYIKAQVTKNPLALGTLFKRANYNGILIRNNATYSSNIAPGSNGKFIMTDGQNLTWAKIDGYAYSAGYSGLTIIDNAHTNFEWGRFEAEVNGQKRHYRVPTLKDYTELNSDGCAQAVGVVYTGNATETAMTVDDAYGFEDYDNTGDDSGGTTTRGMRGIIVYNSSTANQVFFPIGARGMGRRTITGYTSTGYDSFGTLRYGGVINTLTGTTNAYRPIPFNMPAAPGAIYWMNKVEKNCPGWDMNYFDMNFNAYDYAISFSYAYKDGWLNQSGDALPIKLVRDEADM